MEFKLFLLLTLITFVFSDYDGLKARDYAEKHWNNPNHDCKTDLTSCTPYGYYGSEHCGYENKGFLSRDDANFLSQCLLEAGHEKLHKPNSFNCIQFNCGAIDIIPRFAACLNYDHAWIRKLGQEPPEDVQIGDILVYHKYYDSDWESHACLIVEVTPEVKVACHSPEVYGFPYKEMKDYKIYEWLIQPKPIVEEQ